MSVGLNVRRLAGMHLLRHEELADYLGITKAGVSNLMTGRSQPSMKTARLLASGFGVSIEALFAEDPKVPLSDAIRAFDEAPLAKRSELSTQTVS